MHYQLDHWRQSSWRKDNRYYQLTLCQNIFGHWIVVRTWGSFHSQGAGQSLTMECRDYQEALQVYQKQHHRREQRGYVQLPS